MIRLTRDRDFYRTLFAIALPAAFQSLITQLVNLADNAMVGRLGTAALAGVNQSFSITNLFNMTVLGLISGSSVLISQYWGRRDTQRIKQVFGIVLKIVFILSLAVSGLIMLMPERILGAVTDQPSVIAAAAPYFSLVCLSYIPFAVSQALIGMLRAVEIVKIALAVSLASLVVNVGLNAVLIFGLLGFPALGVAGAAIATIAARLVELAIVWIYAFHRQERFPLKPRDLLQSPRELWRDYGRYGLPVGVGDMQWALVGVLKAAIIGRLSEVVIASYAIGEQMLNLGMLFCFAMANGACIVIGKTVGAKDYKKTREYSVTIQWLFLGFGLILSALVFALRGPFVRLYGADAQVLALATDMIALGAVTMIGTCYHASCFTGINRGAGDSRFVMIVDMICGWLIVLPVSYLAAFVWKVDPKWMFLFLRIDQCFKWLIAWIRLRGDKWIKNVTRD